MTVSLAEATAAARRIADGYAYMGDLKATDFEADARLLAGFVLAGDTERLRTALQRVAETTALPYAAEPMLLVDLARDIARAALVGGDSP